MSKVSDFFADKTVLITGATGCLGLAVVEKLLRTTQVARIYALVRGKNPQDRLEAAWSKYLQPCAGTMKTMNKVVAISGDLLLPGLGISQQDRTRLATQVHVVIHMGADIALTKTVHQLAQPNIIAALALAELACSFEHLERFVHTSSLFSQDRQSPTTEDLLGNLGDPEAELQAVLSQTMEHDVKEVFVFNYAYTKNLAERLLAKRYPQLPLMILRPSLIGPAYSEPWPLWTYRKSMPMSNYLYLSHRMPRNLMCTHADPDQLKGANIVDEVPIDFVCNLLLVHLAYGTKGPVNANSSTLHPVTAQECLGYMKGHIPTQRFVQMSHLKTQGLPGIFNGMALQAAPRSNDKTLAVRTQMTAQDTRDYPLDLETWDLRDWARARAAWTIRQRPEPLQSLSTFVARVTLSGAELAGMDGDKVRNKMFDSMAKRAVKRSQRRTKEVRASSEVAAMRV